MSASTRPQILQRGLIAATVGVAIVVGLSIGPGLAAAQPEPAAVTGGWKGAWSASVQRPSPGFEPNWSLDGFAAQTVRQVVRVSVGGSRLRIHLSNAYGTTPLHVAGATIARAGPGASVQWGSLRPLTFGYFRSVEVPAAGSVVSDAIGLRTSPLERLTITMYFAEPTGPATFHSVATATSYRAAGNELDDTGGAFTDTSHSWYYLEGVDTWRVPPRRDAVVAFGDSLTDGALSTVDSNNRYPDELAERLVAAGHPRAVLNAGIGGNRVLTDSPCFGEKALTRFRRDVLDQPGVRTVIVLEGINDIGFSELDAPCFGTNAQITLQELIAGHRELIRQAHANGLRVIGATLLPFKGSVFSTEHGETVRDELNNWIRTSGEYDAVVDFDRTMADPADPDRLNPAYDSGDRLHPNDAGYHAMAEAIDPSAL